MPRLNDPELVAREYADEARLAARIRAWTEFLDGPSILDAAEDAVAEARPGSVLEVGAGWGELATRIRDRTGATVIATDLSMRMATLASSRELPVAVADAARLPFADGAFDAAVANAMLYHLPELDDGLAELARVVSDEGRLVATTFGRNHLREVWELVGGAPVELPFHRGNGAEILRRAFRHVETRAGGGTITFPNMQEVRTYVASTLTRSHLAERVPRGDGPFVAHADHAVFVATGPRRLTRPA
jgi:ubiquinone/menaquinone biosynthesis C-methylase UbiE